MRELSRTQRFRVSAWACEGLQGMVETPLGRMIWLRFASTKRRPSSSDVPVEEVDINRLAETRPLPSAANEDSPRVDRPDKSARSSAKRTRTWLRPKRFKSP